MAWPMGPHQKRPMRLGTAIATISGSGPVAGEPSAPVPAGFWNCMAMMPAKEQRQPKVKKEWRKDSFELEFPRLFEKNSTEPGRSAAGLGNKNFAIRGEDGGRPSELNLSDRYRWTTTTTTRQKAEWIVGRINTAQRT